MRAVPAGQIGIRVVVVLLTVSGENLRTLLRSSSGRWSLPADRPGYDEPLRHCAERVVAQQLGTQVDWLEQLYTFGNRIPQGEPGLPAPERCIDITYYGLVPQALVATDSGAGDRQLGWFGESEQPPLSWEDSQIIRRAHARLRGKLAYTAVGFELLPPQFSLAELQKLYEVILGKRLDKRNFRRRIAELGILEPTGAERSRKRGRPAALYRFRAEVFQNLESKGDVLAF